MPNAREFLETLIIDGLITADNADIIVKTEAYDRIERALQEASASAWDEGYSARVNYFLDLMTVGDDSPVLEPENPYKQVEKES